MVSMSTVHVAVVIPAKDEAERVAATVRACRAVPRVDLVVRLQIIQRSG